MRPVLGAMLCLLSTLVGAQRDLSELRVTYECHDASIHRVLRDLFDKVQVSFLLDDGIEGNLSAHLPPMPFESALQEILKSCHLTYRCGSGVYQIIRRERSFEEQKWIDMHPSEQIQVKDLPETLAPAIQTVNEDSAELLWRILSKSGANFVIGMVKRAPISTKLPEQQIGKTLGYIAQASRSTMTYSHGIWVFAGPFDGPLRGSRHLTEVLVREVAESAGILPALEKQTVNSIERIVARRLPACIRAFR